MRYDNFKGIVYNGEKNKTAILVVSGIVVKEKAMGNIPSMLGWEIEEVIKWIQPDGRAIRTITSEPTPEPPGTYNVEITFINSKVTLVRRRHPSRIYGIFAYKDEGCNYTYMKGPYNSVMAAITESSYDVPVNDMYSYSDYFLMAIPYDLGTKVLDWSAERNVSELYVKGIGAPTTNGMHEVYNTVEVIGILRLGLYKTKSIRDTLSV